MNVMNIFLHLLYLRLCTKVLSEPNKHTMKLFHLMLNHRGVSEEQPLKHYHSS